MAPNLKRAYLEIERAAKEADLIEIWLDQISDLRVADIGQLIKGCKLPVLAVCKDKKEKGKWNGTEKEKFTLLKEAMQAGAEYVDVSIQSKAAFVSDLLKSKKKKSKLIVSFHDFRRTPSLRRLKAIIDKAFSLGADIAKVATFVNDPADNLSLLELMAHGSGKKKILALGMGPKAKMSRIYATQMGAPFMFAPLTKNLASAPGQLTVSELRKAWG